MPRGPRGEKRPADAIGAAIMVAKIAIGEIEDPDIEGRNASTRAAGKKGGRRRAQKLTPERRSEMAHIAAKARWKKDE